LPSSSAFRNGRSRPDGGDLDTHESRKVATDPTGVPAPIRGYYSNAVFVGEHDVALQAEQVLRNIETIFAAHGASMADVLKVTVYVTDIRYLDVIAPVRLRFFPKAGPASAIVEVARLAVDAAKVEIEAVAAVS
jgi:enamine deaminase RidA (YjgF/YER057c/UK114 family)